MAAAFVVSNQNNDLAGSLRQAIASANASPGPDTITFNIPGPGPHIINPASALPIISGPLTLDGYSQPGAQTNNLAVGNNANIQIVLNGSGAGGGQVDGLRVAASNCVVAGLIIQNFSGSGIVVTGAMGCIIKGTLIGQDPSSGLGQGNAQAGILLAQASSCIIGGGSRGDRNRIYGNGGAGLRLSGAAAQDNRIQGNTIGANQTGVLLDATAGKRNRILSNDIFSNALLGIDLNGDGVTPNDLGDNDDGPNSLQNAPFLQIVTAQGGLALIRGRLQSAASTAYHLDFFDNLSPDGSGFGEGQHFVGGVDVMTSSGGESLFFLGLPIQEGAWVTATATSPSGDSSEFSNAELVGSPPAIINAPASQTVYAGDLVALRVLAGGTAPLSYQWFSEGTALAGEVNPVLIFPQAQFNAGCYTVVVTNIYGKATSAPPACLTVVPRPQFIQVPGSVFALQGESAGFCTEVNAPGPISLQWRLNGVNIPGANDFCYTVPSILLRDQGSYDVVFSDGVNALISPVATLVIQDINLPGVADNFVASLSLQGAEGTIGGSNSNATRQAGEPLHAGKPGSKSVWYSWTPPANGIANVNTVGSGFDTLLGVYTGGSLQNLIDANGDEDRGGFLNSMLRFNVQSNRQYQIAVDGFAGASGNFVLSWKLEAINQSLPEIQAQPMSKVVPKGAVVAFSVAATGAGLTYQWFFGAQAIAGATQSTLTIASAQAANVGSYFVRLQSGGNVLDSDTVFLEIDQGPSLLSADKPEDLFGNVPDGGGSGGFVGTFVPVTAGAIGAHLMSNTNATTSPLEPSHCGVIGGASEWYGLVPSEDGLLIIDTVGSDFDTVLAVYRGPAEYTEQILLLLVPVACDNNGAPDGVRSRVCFAATAATNYYVAVDGVSRARGNIQLNWQLRLVPPLTETDGRLLLLARGDLILGTPLIAPVLGFQWQKDGVNLTNATNSALGFCDLQVAQGGDYQLITPASPGPLLQIAVAKLDYSVKPAGGGATFQVTGLASHAVSLQDSRTLRDDWSNLLPAIDAFAPYSHSAFLPQGVNTNRFYRLQLLSP